jgi:trigger factor
VTDASGNVVDLKNLRPDGTVGDPAEETETTEDSDVTEESAQA